MRKVGLLLMMLFLIKVVEAQYVSQKDSLDFNNVNVLIYSNGMMSLDTTEFKIGFTIPKDSGQSPIYSTKLWVAGRNIVNKQISFFGQLYGQPSGSKSAHYSEGPVADSYGSNWKNKYGRLWKLDKTEIDHHRNNWFLPFYSLNSTIASWPAHGDTTNGEAYYLAPFIDFNQNGKYDPQNGDYPCIKGDQAIYTIQNDDRYQPRNLNSFPLEIHLMLYSFGTNNTLKNTVFLEYKVINRSSVTFDSTYIGLWQDYDIGCSDDDFIGCDTNLQVFYGYNGDAFDQDCRGAIGYGKLTPFSGTVFLNKEMTSFMYHQRGTNLGRGDPFTEQHFYNYLHSRWKDGSHLLYGGNGHSSDTINTSYRTNFMLPADPRDSVYWNEKTAGNPPSTRRGVGATGPFIIAPNESIELSLALVFTQDPVATGLDYLDVFDKFKTDVAYVRNFYNTNINYCSYWATGEEEISWKNNIKLFPNPVNNVLNIQLPEGDLNLNIEVYDAFGKTVHKSYLPNGIKYEIDVSSWTKGMYFIRVYNASNAWVEKVMVE